MAQYLHNGLARHATTVPPATFARHSTAGVYIDVFGPHSPYGSCVVGKACSNLFQNAFISPW